MSVPSKIEHFVGGRHVPSADGATFDVADPVSNTAYAQAAAGGPADVDRAVTAARDAFESGRWPGLATRARAKALSKIADGIEARVEQIAALETFDTGLPVTQAKGQAARAAENFRYFADVIVAQHEAALSQPGQLGYVLRRPAGVAGLITPWNTPFMLESWKLAPALASGCTVVLKPAEWTPLSASRLPEIMTEAGVPDGAFNIVHGIGEDAGAALVAHLLHRRPRPPGAPLVGTGPATARLLGQRRHPLLVHRGLRRPRPRRQAAAGDRDRAAGRIGGASRCRRLHRSRGLGGVARRPQTPKPL